MVKGILSVHIVGTPGAFKVFINTRIQAPSALKPNALPETALATSRLSLDLRTVLHHKEVEEL